MTIGELWDKLAQYPDETEVFIGFIEGHSIQHKGSLPFSRTTKQPTMHLNTQVKSW